MIRVLLWCLCGLSGAALFGGFAGVLHPAGDTLAVLRLHAAAALAVTGLLLGLSGARRGWVAVALAAVAAAPFAPLQLARAAAPQSALTLYQKNLSFRLADPAPVIADIRAAVPDVVTLQEVTKRNRAVLAGLADVLPTQHVCPFARVGAVAVAARWPARPGRTICAEGQGLAAVQVDSPHGPLWLVSLHLHWPWPYRQPEQLAHVLPILEGLEGPVLIGGDFNAMPWSHAVRRIGAATGAARVGRAANSFPRYSPWVPLPIDQVLAPGGAGATELRPLLGSDHRGVLARVDPGL